MYQAQPCQVYAYDPVYGYYPTGYYAVFPQQPPQFPSQPMVYGYSMIAAQAQPQMPVINYQNTGFSKVNVPDGVHQARDRSP